MTQPKTPWERAQTALALLAIDPIGLGGIVVRSRVGPARDKYIQLSKEIDPNPAKLHPAMTTDALDGSVDVAATLETGRIIQHDGLLAQTDRLFLLTMAERADPYLAARLAMSLDAGKLRGLIAVDEGADDDEQIAQSLADRLAFHVDLDDLSLADIAHTMSIEPALPGPVDIPQDLPEQLVVLAVQLGIDSMRAPIFALRAAKAHAARSGRNRVENEDIATAVDLVFAHRATQLPQQETPPPPEAEQPETTPPETQQTDTFSIPDDMLLDAVLSALPDGLLDKLNSTASKGGKGAGSGKKTVGNRKGRPLPPRDKTATSGARVDLTATLRAAIPWQTVRKASRPSQAGPIIRPTDLRSKRYQELSDRVLIFAVDASGSAALARLGEAKGAIELLLGEAYSRRDHVALIAFRGTDADTLLPPTRSLVQTKRRLASLPGGGGTPLASGLLSAMTLAEGVRKRGQTPTIVILTDGRSNIALDGSSNREAAAKDAISIGRQIQLCGIDTITIDTGNRPEQSLKSLAVIMSGNYIPLPRADAKKVSDVISQSMQS